jgi:tagatose-1,6-bisphosphate aldolase non-catalytic subunit AgaZ/GatZ
MQIFQVALVFYPSQKNPARPSGMGIYRVVSCWPVGIRCAARTAEMYGRRVLFIATSRKVKAGSRVDPLRLALAGA